MTDDNAQVEPLKREGYSVDKLFEAFSFEVPIYQRVFTWGEEQFERLFKDLKKHFCDDGSKARYYLGIITVVRSKDDQQFILVDGQQRLTCILLLGALFGWGLDHGRLTYAARPADRKALESVYAVFRGVDNVLETSDDTLKRIAMIDNKSMTDFLLFALTRGRGREILERLWNKRELIKTKLTLMISCLPDVPYKDSVFEQNRYFEKMNYGGKQLEPHEILKIKICKGLGKEYIRLWNDVSNFGKRCNSYSIGQTSVVTSDSRAQLFSVLNKVPLSKGAEQKTFLNEIYDQCVEQLEQYEKETEERDDLRRGLISFPMFLLHVRYLYLKGEKEKKDIQSSLSLGDEAYLLDSFKNVEDWGREEKTSFLNYMGEYRDFLDNMIVHIKMADGGGVRYFFYVEEKRKGKSDIRDAVPEDRKTMMQFQSMLYVSSNKDQRWLLNTYEASKGGTFDLVCLKQMMIKELLKEEDNSKRDIRSLICEQADKWPDDLLTYGSENRRWMALLDYLLWEEYESKPLDFLEHCPRFSKYGKEIQKAIRNYVFRRNRSVEHLHAQTDTESIKPGEWEGAKDIFGNLALISASRNSEYGNQPVGGKAEQVLKWLNNGGKLESIKLLLMLAKCNGEDDKWTVESAREHAGEMLSRFKLFLLGWYIEQRFFTFKLSNGYSIEKSRREESPREWCGWDFVISKGDEYMEGWVGWMFGVGDFVTSPRLIIQIKKKQFHAFVSSQEVSGWYEDSFFSKWMHKDLSSGLGDLKKIASKFKNEIEALCGQA